MPIILMKDPAFKTEIIRSSFEIMKLLAYALNIYGFFVKSPDKMECEARLSLILVEALEIAANTTLFL